MSTFLNRLTFVFLATFLTLALTGCSSEDEQRDKGGCVDGEVGCACFANDTCLGELGCVSGVCVDPSAPTDAGNLDVDQAPECVELLPLRLWTTEPSAVAMLFTAEDCATGQVLTGLDESAFSILEDDAPLPVGAAPRVLADPELRVYVTLLIDMSSSTFPILAEVQAGARRFVDELLVEQGLDNVYIDLKAFDGSPRPITLEPPTNDAGRLKAQIDALSEFEGPDVSSTNLHGATRHAVQDLQAHQQRVMD